MKLWLQARCLLETTYLVRSASVDTVKVKMFNGIIKTLGDIRHVPTLKRSFISLSASDAKEHRYTCESEVLRICRANLIVMMGRRVCQLIYFVGLHGRWRCHIFTEGGATKLWHIHLGHVKEKYLIKFWRSSSRGRTPKSWTSINTNSQRQERLKSMRMLVLWNEPLFILDLIKWDCKKMSNFNCQV